MVLHDAELSALVCRSVGEVLVHELMSCWTECAPGQLAASPELTAVQCMEAVLQCLELLLHQLPGLLPSGVSAALGVLTLTKRSKATIGQKGSFCLFSC